MTPGLSAERAAEWEHRWDRLGNERERIEHCCGPVPVRAAPARPPWAADSRPDYDWDEGGLTPAIGAYDQAAYARQERSDAEFLAANERRKRDVLVGELARLQQEVDALDRQVYEAGEARRLAGRLFHDESIKSQVDVSGYAVVSRAVLYRLLSDGLGAVTWGTRPQGPCRSMEFYAFYLCDDLRGFRVTSRSSIPVNHPRGGVLGVRLFVNGVRPISVAHR